MKKTIIAFAIILLVISIPLVSAVEQKESLIKRTEKIGIYKIIQMLKNKALDNPSFVKIILTIIYLIGFFILLVGLTFFLLAWFVLHCLIINPIRAIIEYLNQGNRTNS